MNILEEIDTLEAMEMLGYPPSPNKKYDLQFADEVIRRCGLSVLEEYLSDAPYSLAPDYKTLAQPTLLRAAFYKGQMGDPIVQILHDPTFLVTVDGIRGAGKTTLLQGLVDLLKSVEERVFLGDDGNSYGPWKVSSFDGIVEGVKRHAREVQSGHRMALPDLDFSGNMLHFALALTQVAMARPRFAFLDRSYVTTLAKSPLPHFPTYKGRYLDYAPLLSQVKKMQGKYIIPHLSLILQCDQETSLRHQHQRPERELKAVSTEEVERYALFEREEVIPNAVYIDVTSASFEKVFQLAVQALRSRCAEGRTREDVAQRLHEEAVQQFLSEKRDYFPTSLT